MDKKKIRTGVYMYPLPVVIVGAMVDGKPNFMTVAWASIVEMKPPLISISAHDSHHTNKGIEKHGEFSINISSKDIIVQLDYCGIYSGKEVDKSNVFEVFYGELKNAPMIKESPLNLECKVYKAIKLNIGHTLFIGEVINAYSEEKYLTKDAPDISKINPLIYTMGEHSYRSVGEKLGKAWKIGRNFKKN